MAGATVAEQNEFVLSGADPDPVEVINADGAATFVITGEHAGRHVPEQLGDLGVSDRDRQRHIA